VCVSLLHSRWDEWVPEERVLKFNEENIARQKQLNEVQRAKDRAEREALAERERQLKNAKRAAGASDTGGRPTKRGRDSMAEQVGTNNASVLLCGRCV
jgi:mortality factor 4-like protein 1